LQQLACRAQAISRISISSATTTQLVGLVSNQAIYVCGFSFDVVPSATTADTAQLSYGTGTNCGTGTTALTGQYGAGYATTGPPILYTSGGQDMTAAKAPTGNALCLVSAGTTVSIQGVLTYVQQ
jgi:hypothetical protein